MGLTSYPSLLPSANALGGREATRPRKFPTLTPLYTQATGERHAYDACENIGQLKPYKPKGEYGAVPHGVLATVYSVSNRLLIHADGHARALVQ